LYNTENVFKFKDLKSTNSQFLGSERTVRLLKNLNTNSYKWNISSSPNQTKSLSDMMFSYGSTPQNIYSGSVSNWVGNDKQTKYSGNMVWMPASHIPLMSNNPFFANTSFDFFSKGSDDITPMVLRSKEESAPNYTFSTYWSSYWSLTNITNRLSYISNSANLLNNFYFPFFTEYAEYDFRN